MRISEWEWLSEQVRAIEYEDDLDDRVNASQRERLWEVEPVGMFRWGVSHTVSEFSMVKTKRSFCILPNTHSGKWCIPTSNHVACCITTSSMDNMYRNSAVHFMTDFRIYFICYVLLLIIHIIDSIDCVYVYIYSQCQIYFIFIVRNF